MEKTGDLGRRLTVELPGDQIERKIDGRLQELRGQVRLKGFRPGKVPIQVVRQRYGGQVRQEVIQEAMQEALAEAAEQQQLRVAGVTAMRPEEATEGGVLRFVAELEVYPELPEFDLSDLEIERPVVEITEQDVDDMIRTLQRQRAQWVPVDRASASGDRVRAAFAATPAEGARFPESGTRTISPVLGEGALFEGLEKLLEGRKAGDRVAEEVEFPENFGVEGLAGKTARVELEIEAVEALDLPELDDDFAASFGVEGGIEQLRKDVRRNLEREMRTARTNRIKQAVGNALLERFSDLPLPESVVQQEMAHLVSRLRAEYGEKVNVDPATIRPSAERRVRLGLILAEIARREGIAADPARIEDRIAEIAETYEDSASVVEWYRRNPQARGEIENSVIEEQVLEWVLEQGVSVDHPISFKQLLEAV
ncbi:MAG: trigger factor [Wenzhouxiangellaceae bacterium]